MKLPIHFSNRLYWKISATLLGLLLLLGLGFIYLTTQTSQGYLQEVNQQLNKGVAAHLVAETTPLVAGKVDTGATHDIMHSMMVINPSVEVYLLDTAGNIIDYVVPFEEVQLEQVALEPVRTFLQSEGEAHILGDDPKAPGVQNIFSAAPILEDGRLSGYAYIILASQEQKSVAAAFFNSYILRMGIKLFLLILAAALAVGLLAIWLITRNLSEIIEIVKKFKEGDMQARIPLRSKDGELRDLANTFNEMADQIVRNIERLKSVENLRKELIANVSHDLRTPLAILQGYTETLMIKEADLTDTERRKFLGIVFDSSEKLGKLVSQLFEYSKLESNQIEPEKEPFFLTDLAQDTLAKYQILAAEKEIELNLQAPRDLPLVFADVALVERVIQNLVDNALKFTPNEGKVIIELKGTGEGVEVRITDNGPGIPEADQAFIFERYRQVASTPKGKGAGLGLAIVKKILEIHNATIQMQSQSNRGTSFWFSLPAYQHS